MRYRQSSFRLGDPSRAVCGQGLPKLVAAKGCGHGARVLLRDEQAADPVADLLQRSRERLDVAAGTAVRFEPGIARDVDLVPLGGTRVVPGLTLPAPGRLDGPA